MSPHPDPFRAAPTGWEAAEWRDFADWLRIEGFVLQPCAHDDRWTPGDPNSHPSSLIVEDETQRREASR